MPAVPSVVPSRATELRCRRLISVSMVRGQEVTAYFDEGLAAEFRRHACLECIRGVRSTKFIALDNSWAVSLRRP